MDQLQGQEQPEYGSVTETFEKDLDLLLTAGENKSSSPSREDRPEKATDTVERK